MPTHTTASEVEALAHLPGDVMNRWNRRLEPSNAMLPAQVSLATVNAGTGPSKGPLPLCQQGLGNFILRVGRGGAYADYTARVNLNTKSLDFV